jgi:hypothetical protein
MAGCGVLCDIDVLSTILPYRRYFTALVISCLAIANYWMNCSFVYSKLKTFHAQTKTAKRLFTTLTFELCEV